MFVLEWEGPRPVGVAGYYALPVRHPFTCGRLDTCDIMINSPDVSRQHVAFQVALAEKLEYAYARAPAGDEHDSSPVDYATGLDSDGGAEPETPNPDDVIRGGSAALRPTAMAAASPFRAHRSPPPLRGGASAGGSVSPSRKLLSDRTAVAGSPGNTSQLFDGDTSPIALVVTNHSKFGTSVNGRVITGSARVPNGGVVALSATAAFRVRYVGIRAVVSSMYDARYRQELCEMLTQLGVEVADAPTPAHKSLDRESASPQTAPPPPSRHQSASAPPPAQHSSVAQPNTTLGSFFITEQIDFSAECLLAIALNYSVVLPAFVFELLACLADRCAEPLPLLPHPATFEPPRAIGIAGIYLRPEPRSVPFTLYRVPPSASAINRDRSELFATQTFAIRDRAVRETLGPAIVACGGVIVEWQATQTEARGEDELLSLPVGGAGGASFAVSSTFVMEDGESDVQTATDVDTHGDSDHLSRRSPRSSLMLRHQSTVKSKSYLVKASEDTAKRTAIRRYAVASPRDVQLLQVDYNPATPLLSEEAAQDANLVGQCRGEFALLVDSGWMAINSDTISTAILTGRFAPAAVLAPGSRSLHQLAAASNSKDKELIASLSAEALRARELDDLGKILTKHERLLQKQHSPLAHHEGLLTRGLDDRRAPSTDDASSSATPSDLDAHDEALRLEAHIEEQRQAEAASGLHTLGQRGVASRPFDIALQRLQTTLDRSILSVKARVSEELQNARKERHIPPATIAFIEQVIQRCDKHLTELEQLAQSKEASHKSLVLRDQWDESSAVRATAAAVIALLTSRGLHPGIVGKANNVDAADEAAAAVNELDVPPSNPGGVHYLPARRGASALRVAPRADGRLLAASPSVALDRLSTASLLADSGDANRKPTRRAPHAASLGDATRSQTPSGVRPVSVGGLRASSRAARYNPPAPRRTTYQALSYESVATPLAGASNVSFASIPRSVDSGHSRSGRNDASARALNTSVLVPSDLEAIRKQKLLFVRKWGDDEGSTRFRLWIQSQPKEWTHVMFRTLEDRGVTLSQLIDLSLSIF